MILNSIFLHLDGRFFPREMCLKLKDQSRHITYCIQRSLKLLKYPLSNFNRIVIEPSINPTRNIFINSESVASISIDFNVDKIINSSDDELNKYYVLLIKNALNEFNKQIKIPVDIIFEEIDKLAINNFVDIWVYRKKSFKKLNLVAKLVCLMNNREFNLDLVLEENLIGVYRETILSTVPDEIAFNSQFKDLLIKDGFIEVTKRFPNDGYLFKRPIAELLNKN